MSNLSVTQAVTVGSDTHAVTRPSRPPRLRHKQPSRLPSRPSRTRAVTFAPLSIERASGSSDPHTGDRARFLTVKISEDSRVIRPSGRRDLTPPYPRRSSQGVGGSAISGAFDPLRPLHPIH